MPMPLKNEHRIIIGRHVDIHSTSDELWTQLQAERRQHAYNLSQLEEEKALLVRDLMQARFELARRDMADVFASTPSPSEERH